MIALSRLDWRLFLCLMGLGILGTWVPLFDLDEGAFLEATREMLNGGHWAATTLDGEPRAANQSVAFSLYKQRRSALGTWLPAGYQSNSADDSPLCYNRRTLGIISWVVSSRPHARRSWPLCRSPLRLQHWARSLLLRAATADALANLWLALFTDIAR